MEKKFYLFIFAEPLETEQLRLKYSKHLEQIKIDFENDFQNLYELNWNNKQILLAHCGVGKTNSALMLSYLLTKFNILKVINIGPAISIFNGCVGDIYCIQNCKYYDVNLTALPNYKIGQLPSLQDVFHCNQDLKICSNFKKANIITGDSFINKSIINSNILDWNTNNLLGDMECCSLAHTSFIFSKPFYSFKVISDCLESNNNLEYRQSKAIWELKIIDIFKDILGEL
ncbi:hypothetical protein C1937_00050 [Metamycoplasma hominis]|uniref:5'-methylthioadenosine/S-adenosylhomocysteine nucleosidase n=1 Tax=Metamycoplasma hominis TaxID=2098 RepID=UPI000CD67C33|nr:5'-methylthioadenosine/S-adenosylhomocysteine nucleosidase [Metamycoplasma hominis]AUW36865.1 hypothetical protein C1937_00050 [Metamycoplasma hominis]